MSYSPERQQELVNEREKKLNRDLQICRDVKATLDSPGWVNTIGPILDAMIVSVLGGKVEGKWLSGKLNRARTDERREFYIGSKQALIEFHQRVNNHPRQIELIEKQITEIEIDREKGYRDPMEDTRYLSGQEI